MAIGRITGNPEEINLFLDQYRQTLVLYRMRASAEE
jgi:hypothetical protein